MSNSPRIEVSHLQEFLVGFAKDRDWEKFHTPKNLAMALAGEAGELVEIFQWLTTEESENIMDNEENAVKVREELADIMIYSIRMAGILGIDVDKAIWDKMEKNAKKYPVHLAKGKATKYTDL